MGAEGWREDNREFRVRQTWCWVLAVGSFLICEMGASAGTFHRRTTEPSEQRHDVHNASRAFAHSRATWEGGAVNLSVLLIN